MVKTPTIFGVLSSLLVVEGGLTNSKVPGDAYTMRVSPDGSFVSERSNTAFVQVSSDTGDTQNTTTTKTKNCAMYSDDCAKDLRPIVYFSPLIGCNRYSSLCDKILADIIFPGTTHSSFSAEDSIKDYNGSVITDKGRIHQPIPIKAQLEAGIRYLDISVGLDNTNTVVAASGFKKGVDIDNQIRYLFAQPVKTILDEVEDFLSTYVNDVVVVDFSSYAPERVLLKKTPAKIPSTGDIPLMKDGTPLMADTHPCITGTNAAANIDCVDSPMVAIYHEFQPKAAVEAMKEMLEARYSVSSTEKTDVEKGFEGKYSIDFLIPKKEWTNPTMTLGELISANKRLAIVSEEYLTSSLEEVILSGQTRADPTSKKFTPSAVYPSRCGTASADRSLMVVDYSNHNTLETEDRRAVAYNVAVFREEKGTSWASKELSRCWTAQINKERRINFLATEHFDAMRPTVLDVTSELNIGTESPSMTIWLDLLLKILMLTLLFIVIASATGYLVYQQIMARAKPPAQDGSFKPENALPPPSEPLLDGQHSLENMAENDGEKKEGQGWGDLISIVDQVKAAVMLVRPEFAGGDPLPAKWKRYVDEESGQVYFYNHETSNSAWESEVWIEFGSDEEGGRYMHNVVSGRSVWLDDWQLDCERRAEAEAKAIEEYEKALANGAVEVSQEEFDAANEGNAGVASVLQGETSEVIESMIVDGEVPVGLLAAASDEIEVNGAVEETVVEETVVVDANGYAPLEQEDVEVEQNEEATDLEQPAEQHAGEAAVVENEQVLPGDATNEEVNEDTPLVVSNDAYVDGNEPNDA
eukprot:GDKJ01056690.1.p1 GENE.GDKJ01056690.1~~GDKJ01056690.1.p1  ORF type:complete len:810 (-),score=221.05 GDKJ01056690.1:397-2826(-)